jgi:hypothetical protein
MKHPFLKGAFVGGIGAALVLAAGAAFAVTGGNFVLGQANSAADSSALISGVTTLPTLRVNNTGGRPAAGFIANAGIQPFSVNNSTRIAGLNADLLDGLHAAAFLRTTGKAADSDLLDGVDATGFYAAGSKVADSAHADTADSASSASSAANADALDGIDSLGFARSTIYVRTMVTNGSANASGTCPSGDLCFAGGYYCDTGDTLLGGGFAEIDNGTRLVASEPFVPNPTDAWRVKFVNNSTEDTITVYTICADNGTPH